MQAHTIHVDGPGTGQAYRPHTQILLSKQPEAAKAQARINIMSDLAAWAPPQAIAAAAAPDPASAPAAPSTQPAPAQGGALAPWGAAAGAHAQQLALGLGTTS